MPDTSPADLAALGFLGLSPTYWKELRLAPQVIKVVVADEWDEKIDAVSRTFLGLTVACARCHDHKFDPITTARLLRPGRRLRQHPAGRSAAARCRTAAEPVRAGQGARSTSSKRNWPHSRTRSRRRRPS